MNKLILSMALGLGLSGASVADGYEAAALKVTGCAHVKNIATKTYRLKNLGLAKEQLLARLSAHQPEVVLNAIDIGYSAESEELASVVAWGRCMDSN